MTSDREVGWYGAAAGLSGITLMLAPLVSWVLTPMYSRAANVSEDELFRLFRRSIEFMMALSIPLSLFMALGSSVWISFLFGSAFAPASGSLRILAAGTVLMYLSIVAGSAMTALGHTWRMSAVFIGGMIINPLCNLVLINYLSASGRSGRAGMACAISTFITELCISIPLVSMLGIRTIDKRLVLSISKSLVAAAFVWLIDSMVFERIMGEWRLVADFVVYGVAVLVSGAVDVRGMIQLINARRNTSKAS
jgi:O-antigen/teichoic acid export membrane protein